jgi:hypothetical protein
MLLLDSDAEADAEADGGDPTPLGGDVAIELVVPKACTPAKAVGPGGGPSKRERATTTTRTDKGSGNLTRGAIDASDGRLGLPRRRLACLSSNEKGQEGRRADPGAAATIVSGGGPLAALSGAAAAESAVASAPRIVGRKSRKRVG